MPRRQSSHQALSRPARLQADRRADQGAARAAPGHVRRAPDAAAAPRRCRLRQNGRGGVLRVDGTGKRLPRRPHGPDRSPGGTAFRELHPLAGAAGRRGGTADGQPEDGPSQVRSPKSEVRSPKSESPACRSGGQHRQPDADDRHACADRGRVRAGEPWAGHHRRATQVRRGAARTTGAQGPLPASAGDDRHAHSAHAGPDALRRAGRVRH